MNIQEAKIEIENTLRTYLRKDENGHYVFPTVRQRPILLMGPPGVGKTAIMEQVARDCNVALVAYTMTHHTRQSAIGLPQIESQTFGQQIFSVTTYTMSEIIAQVYAIMERTGKREGILFLDEINCVSETLAPTMLQFLQNKTFGNHRLPEGWLIVAAGNPPEYNKSVREFDIVTLDRIRQIDVEANVEVFLAYGRERGLHGAVLSYLGLHPERFYHVSRTETELHFVTARGWEDLSQILLGYEELNIPVTEALIAEYLHLPDTCRDFYGYYCLYRKYGTDYGIREILCGEAEEAFYEEKCRMAKSGDFTERFTVVNLVAGWLQVCCRRYVRQDRAAVQLHEVLKNFFDRTESLDAFLAARRSALETKKQFALVSFEELRREESLLSQLEAMNRQVQQCHLHERAAVEDCLRQQFGEVTARRSAMVEEVRQVLRRGIDFITDCFGDGQELTLLISQMTGSAAVMDYIARHGCESFVSASSRLLVHANEQELQKACQAVLYDA